MMSEAKALQAKLREHANAENAVAMSKYMKDHFPFFGIKSPQRRELANAFLKEHDMLKQPFNRDFVRELWELPERELQIVAIDYSVKFVKKMERDDILLLRDMITQKSWWDTVDAIASNLVGPLCLKFEDLQIEYIEPWSTDEHLWLRRTSIIYQLGYKANTDEQALYTYIERNSNSKEFFIQKAIGWALRQYSKTNPESVRHFIETHELAKLSVREGSKYI
jgi:3-methyladenine DNA glycosylase AlkD